LTGRTVYTYFPTAAGALLGLGAAATGRRGAAAVAATATGTVLLLLLLLLLLRGGDPGGHPLGLRAPAAAADRGGEAAGLEFGRGGRRGVAAQVVTLKAKA
jgi:hypothetical protein